jgi:hypothetical protein
MTGAAGYIASQMLPTFRERYDLVLVDVTQKNRQGEDIKDIWAYKPAKPNTLSFPFVIRSGHPSGRAADGA